MTPSFTVNTEELNLPNLTSQITFYDPKEPLIRGGFAEIFKGYDSQGRVLALKRPIFKTGDVAADNVRVA